MNTSKTNEFNAALELAIEYEAGYVVKLLLENGADLHTKNNKLLKECCRKDNKKLIELLIKHGANLHENDEEALKMSAFNGYENAIEILLFNGANIHADNDYAFRWAVENGHIEIVRILIKNGADLQADNNISILILLNRIRDAFAGEISFSGFLDEDREAGKIYTEILELLIKNGASHPDAVKTAKLYGIEEKFMEIKKKAEK